jgi:nicotinamidase-related amidase
MKKALLVIDVQEALNQYEDSNLNHWIKGINQLITSSLYEHIIYIRHLEIGSEFDPSLNSSEFHHALIIKHAHIIEKYHHSAFFKTPLNDLLLSLEIKDIDICGFQIEFCVDATIKTAHFLGFNVSFYVDHIHTFDQAHGSKDFLMTHYQHMFLAYAKPISS